MDRLAQPCSTMQLRRAAFLYPSLMKASKIFDSLLADKPMFLALPPLDEDDPPDEKTKSFLDSF